MRYPDPWPPTPTRKVRAYELARLAQLRAKGLLPARPMEAAPDSPAGLAERLTVGLLRAPLVLERLVARTAELLRAAEGAADAEHAARKAEEKKARAAALRRRQLGEAKEAAERGPQLASAVLKRTQVMVRVPAYSLAPPPSLLFVCSY